MNITYTFQITNLAKFQEEPSANMYDSDDGIKRSTFDLKICTAKVGILLLHIYYYCQNLGREGHDYSPTPVPTVLTNLHGGGDVPVTFGGGNGGCLGAKGFEFGSNFDGTDWLPDPPFCSSPQSPPSTKRSIPADQFWYCIPKSEKVCKVIYIISRLNKCFE
jgi:hypothetical protein